MNIKGTFAIWMESNDLFFSLLCLFFSSLSSAVTLQLQVLVSLSPSPWRRTTAVAVTFLPSNDSFWTETLKKSRLSTHPAMTRYDILNEFFSAPDLILKNPEA